MLSKGLFLTLLNPRFLVLYVQWYNFGFFEERFVVIEKFPTKHVALEISSIEMNRLLTVN